MEERYYDHFSIGEKLIVAMYNFKLDDSSIIKLLFTDGYFRVVFMFSDSYCYYFEMYSNDDFTTNSVHT